MNKSELIIMRKIVALQQKLKDIAFTGLYSDLIGSPIVPSIESNYNNIEFVDLDLPSGTSWAIKNILPGVIPPGMKEDSTYLTDLIIIMYIVMQLMLLWEEVGLFRQKIRLKNY